MSADKAKAPADKTKAPADKAKAPKANRLKVVLCWHMHQPDYQDRVSGEYELPWVYLHGIKDYVDMAVHLEDQPKARAVVNFAPILLEQLTDYAEQVRAFLEHGTPLRDRLLAALGGESFPAEAVVRQGLIRACLRANDKHLVNRFKPFHRLVELARSFEEHPEELIYLGDQYLADLAVWYHLAWMGESVRTRDARIRALQDKAMGYSLADRRQLLGIIGDLLAGLIPRYRRLAETGRVELSTSPYAHPIVPLLLDIGSAREAMPEMVLPELAAYPGGRERAVWQIRRGLEVFKEHFGFLPVGCWPSEGSVSEATLKLLEQEGFRWVASGQEVLHNSLSAAASGHQATLPAQWPHVPYRFNGGKLWCFFRDNGLSDLIGFSYADWHADDAVANLVHHLEQIADLGDGEKDRVVSIILDGENAWEYYPFNGCYFLTSLYKQLAEHPRLELTTFSACMQDAVKPRILSKLVAGSWVYGTFSTWIGDRDKNRGWDMLGDAKRAFDLAVAGGRLQGDELAKAEKQLAICEGSDWFWWFGDYNPGQAVGDFERLYRRQLCHLYHLIDTEPPQYLSQVISRGSDSSGPAHGGVMKHSAH